MATLPPGEVIMAQLQKPIRALHEKIICRKKQLIPSSAGEFTESWHEIATLWADVISEGAVLKNTARQSHLAGIYLFRVRYREDLLATRNILWQGREYRVVSLVNPDNRKKILQFSAEDDRT